MNLLLLPLAAGFIALLFAWFLVSQIKKKDRGTPKMAEISDLIHSGALSFLNAQYRILAVFIVIVAVVLAFIPSIGPNTAISFVIGAVLSLLSGNIGMKVATTTNSRAAQGCTKSLNTGLKIAFSSGAVMGMCVVGMGVLGVIFTYLVFNNTAVLFGFGFGASSVALFARVGGGIYTKAADVGADLVGKVEHGIPEDDPRNPAVIADNVGDNVGDVAGMGADLFESYVESIIAAMVLGAIASGLTGLWLPLILSGVGIICSILGTFFVGLGEGSNPYNAINRGIFAASILMAVISYFAVDMVLGPGGLGVYIAMLSGLFAGIIIGLSTQYYTSPHRGPTKSIAEAAQTGAGTNVITGLSVGMESTAIPILAVTGAMLASYHFAGLYGIAIAAVGMLSTMGITLASESYGSVADNAAGIAEMAHVGGKTRERAEMLDAVGNTTAAIGKGFAIGSAALTALALFAVYGETVGLEVISITNPLVIAGFFLGALLTFVFAGIAMKAVGKTAHKIVNNVRKQFKNKKIMSGKAKPNYHEPISIATTAALREMLVPGVLAVVAPVAVGLVLGPAALGGLLAGATTTGFLIALFMANAGGAWDNAKKYIEEGNLGGKGSDTHKAAVVGDTVGDPFKDAAGPSMNILIKLMSVVAILSVPLLAVL